MKEEGDNMPHVAITMIPGRNQEQKMHLAEQVQTLLIQELQIDKKFISVSVEDIPKENWQESMEKFTDDILYIKPDV